MELQELTHKAQPAFSLYSTNHDKDKPVFCKLFSASDRKGEGLAIVLLQDELPYFVNSVNWFYSLDLDDYP